MLALVIDTSSAAVTAGLVDVTAGPTVSVVGESVHVDARAHGELLAPSIAAILADTHTAPGQLSAVVAGVGPGPFTGLRIGLVTAAALADALSIPTYGVCSLDAIALAAPPGADLLVATDARRKEVYWACYTEGVRSAGPDVARPAQLRDLLGPDGWPTARVGAGIRLYDGVIGPATADIDSPPVAALARLAAERVLAGAPSEPLSPLYLRKPDAVEPTAAKPVLA